MTRGTCLFQSCAILSDEFKRAGIRSALYPFCLYLLSKADCGGRVEVSTRQASREFLNSVTASSVRKIALWRAHLKRDQVKSGIRLIWPIFEEGRPSQYLIGSRLTGG